MAASPLLLEGLTYLTTVWQLAAPLALLSRRLRVLFVTTALLFHIFIALSMRVGWFSEIMIASSLLFWDDFAYYFRREQQPGEGVEEVMEKEAVVARPRTRNFLIAYLFLFAVTQIYFISVAAGGPINWLRQPAEWMAKITGNRPYDLVPALWCANGWSPSGRITSWKTTRP